MMNHNHSNAESDGALPSIASAAHAALQDAIAAHDARMEHAAPYAPRVLVRPDARLNPNRQDHLMRVAAANHLNGVRELCSVLRTNYSTLVSLPDRALNSYFAGFPVSRLAASGGTRFDSGALGARGLSRRARICPLCVAEGLRQYLRCNLAMPVNVRRMRSSRWTAARAASSPSRTFVKRFPRAIADSTTPTVRWFCPLRGCISCTASLRRGTAGASAAPYRRCGIGSEGRAPPSCIACRTRFGASKRRPTTILDFNRRLWLLGAPSGGLAKDHSKYLGCSSRCLNAKRGGTMAKALQPSRLFSIFSWQSGTPLRLVARIGGGTAVGEMLATPTHYHCRP